VLIFETSWSRYHAALKEPSLEAIRAAIYSITPPWP
jgi:hypothetical protein